LNRIEIATNIAMREEGWRGVPYYCTEGYPTIGWGFKIGNKGDPLPNVTMTHTEGDKKLSDLISGLDHTLTNDHRFSTAYQSCDEVRKACMIMIPYQIGVDGFAAFKPTLDLIIAHNWSEVAKHIRGALAYKQTPARWERLAKYFETGKY
jgi:lysozyme